MASGGYKGNKKGSILDLNRYLEKSIRVKFQGGREVTGILKGFDSLVNLVLDESVELLRDPTDLTKLSGETRPLGLTVAKGTSVMTIAPTDGMHEIANPFVEQAAAAEQSIAPPQ